MILKIKKLDPAATIPTFATKGSAGLDLTAVSQEYTNSYGDFADILYGTGLSFEIPSGYVGLIYPRSSIYKYHQYLTNSVGVLDSDYRGEVKFRFKAYGYNTYEIGDRIGQLVIMKIPSFEIMEVDELSETVRGVGGFGSTGK